VLTDGDWGAYEREYIAQMRTSYRLYREHWDALLAKERVVLVCYCTDHTKCHRVVLAGILVKLGATYVGETT
jgi:uncharacterized protein YeaO (DUF488 family)